MKRYEITMSNGDKHVVRDYMERKPIDFYRQILGQTGLVIIDKEIVPNRTRVIGIRCEHVSSICPLPDTAEL